MGNLFTIWVGCYTRCHISIHFYLFGRYENMSEVILNPETPLQMNRSKPAKRRKDWQTWRSHGWKNNQAKMVRHLGDSNSGTQGCSRRCVFFWTVGPFALLRIKLITLKWFLAPILRDGGNELCGHWCSRSGGGDFTNMVNLSNRNWDFYGQLINVDHGKVN